MENPYDTSPLVEFRDPPPPRPASASLWILGLALVFTYLFAIKNTREEGFPWLLSNTWFVVAIAGVSQIPGIFVALYRRNRKSRATIPLLLGAYFIALTGTAAYAKFAFDGQADSINSAAHMHIFAFPAVHCVLAVVVYVATGIVTGILVGVSRRKTGNDSTT